MKSIFEVIGLLLLLLLIFALIIVIIAAGIYSIRMFIMDPSEAQWLIAAFLAVLVVLKIVD